MLEKAASQNISSERLYSDEEVEWEGKMAASEAIASSLRLVTAPSTAVDASKFRRLAHLNALPKMWAKNEDEDDGLKLKEIMLCLRIPLVHESADIRAAALRTLRQLTKSMDDVEAMLSLNVHYLITRCQTIIQNDSKSNSHTKKDGQIAIFSCNLAQIILKSLKQLDFVTK